MSTPGTELATTSGALAVRPDQTSWSDEQLAMLRHMATDKASTADLRVFLHRCQTLDLDPFAGQIHMVEYGGKPVIQVGIHGLESIADRTAAARGVPIEWEDVHWCGPDGQWTDVWLSDEPPAAARVVLRVDGRQFPAVALYREFVGMKRVYVNRQPVGWEVNAMWISKPAHMLGKVARAAALRTAFPTQMSGVHIPEELGERPDTVRGEVVRDSPQPEPSGLDRALELVAAATSVDELVGIWHDSVPGLTVTERAHLQKACADAKTALSGADSGASDSERARPVTVVHRATSARDTPDVSASGPRESREKTEIYSPVTSGRESTSVTEVDQDSAPVTRDMTASDAIQDAEIVGDEPLITPAQTRQIGALIGAWETRHEQKLDRDERRYFIAELAGVKHLQSAKDLTVAQASKAIEALILAAEQPVADEPQADEDGVIV